MKKYEHYMGKQIEYSIGDLHENLLDDFRNGENLRLTAGEMAWIERICKLEDIIKKQNEEIEEYKTSLMILQKTK